ncbi:hypothetical protein N473_00630 [Pseudoalteromonas luteoviolacea CPMOR-1]|uniref:SIS domain-containing protein n=1 Tax=Pseudoalteromonas luteoviolacea CPMOR-1 TaxID=1365248 RepID=A0A167LS40_9GAMM|nr:SIS domain-containing protein [Pseudoalteromonas luteoviolacea]KZN65105.1 hypothetical protein N473_00630 [Pseudoalteromonas luteoviolacea CPMOR-1]
MSSHNALPKLPDISIVDTITQEYVNNLSLVLQQLNHQDVKSFTGALMSMRKRSGTLYICGNGGSAANAIHLANDFTFGICPSGDALKVEALSANSSVLTCLGNDIGYENIFSHQLKVKASEKDMLLVLSGSGNSPNIINAIEQARHLNMMTVGVLGYSGGKAKPRLDLPFHFNIDDMQVSEDMQVILGHILMQSLHQLILQES